MRYGLSADQIEHYRREGYLLIPSLFAPEDIKRVDTAIQGVIRAAFASGDYASVLELEPEAVEGAKVVRRLYNPFEVHAAFRGLASDDRLLDPVECLIGYSIQLQHSKLNMKAALVGSPVEWHQDLSYFPHTNPDLVTTLIYLDDARRENGCLQVLPRNHHRILPCHTPEGVFAGLITEDITALGEPVSLEGPPGSVIFMHCLTPHSSLPNRSPLPRRTLIFEYRAGDAYPIYFSPQVAKVERYTHQLRGEPSRHARLAGPPPLIPAMPEDFTSLYQLQEESKRRAKE